MSNSTILPVVDSGVTKTITGSVLRTYTGTSSGPQGPQGATGPQGPSGAQGPSGPAGSNANAGSVTAVASGTLPNGATVILNSNGTVSAGAVSVGNMSLLSQTLTGGIGVSTSNYYQFCGWYSPVTNKVAVIWIDYSSNYVYGTTGTISANGSISFLTPTQVGSSYNCSPSNQNPLAGAYDSVSDTFVALWYSTQGGTAISLRLIIASGATNFSTAALWTNWAYYNGSYPRPYGLSVTISNGVVLIGYCLNTTDNILQSGVVTASSLTIYQNGFRICAGGQYVVTRGVALNPSGSYYVALCHDYFNSVITAATGTLSGSSWGTVYRTDIVSGQEYYAGSMSMNYDTASDKFVFIASKYTGVWYAGLITANSGTSSVTLNQFTQMSLSVSENYAARSVYYPAASSSYVGAGNYLYQITISGTSFSIGSQQDMIISGNRDQFFPFAIGDTNYLGSITAIGSTNPPSVVYATAVTSNITANNFLGFSSASYTNGQTATINVVGGTNDGQSSLTPGLKYYVNSNGTLGTSSSNPYAGLALTSTKILVKG
jgi:hypothetical protein